MTIEPNRVGAMKVDKALQERRERLASQVPPREPRAEVMRFLDREVWLKVLPELLGRGLTKEEQEEILGYGPGGL